MNVFLEPSNGTGITIPIDKAIVFIGRHPDCDVVITRSRMISRKHCAIVQVNNSLVIRDLGSTNGIRVNGQKVRKESRFGVGDTVTIGDIDYAVKGVKSREPERRANRDHPQDARDAGAIPLRLEPVGKARSDEIDDSQELPVAIPEDDEEVFEAVEDANVFDAEVIDSDTPDAFPLVPERNEPQPADSDHSGRKGPRRKADENCDFPLSD